MLDDSMFSKCQICRQTRQHSQRAPKQSRGNRQSLNQILLVREQVGVAILNSSSCILKRTNIFCKTTEWLRHSLISVDSHIFVGIIKCLYGWAM